MPSSHCRRPCRFLPCQIPSTSTTPIVFFLAESIQIYPCCFLWWRAWRQRCTNLVGKDNPVAAKHTTLVGKDNHSGGGAVENWSEKTIMCQCHVACGATGNIQFRRRLQVMDTVELGHTSLLVPNIQKQPNAYGTSTCQVK